MRKHWSDKIIDDLVGAFRIFFTSAILIYIALMVAKALYPTFPLDNNSYVVVAGIFGLFVTFFNYTKFKNKY